MRLFRWSSILGGFAVVQLIVQALNAVSGFLVVRTLEKPDYAWFTIASGMSAALAALSDSGVGIAVNSIGGTIWQDKASMKALVQAALRMRLKLAVIASVVVACISMGLLLRNGAGLASALGLTALVLAPIWQISTTAVLNVVNRLHSRTRQLQVADLAPAVVRASFTAALALMGGLSPITALGAVVVAQLTQYRIVRRQVLPLLGIAVEAQKTEEHFTHIWKISSQFLPTTIFWCLQGQLTTWLISIFATAREVADFGALNRLSIIFMIIGGPLGQFIVPAFARTSDRRRLWRMAALIVAGAVIFFSVLLLLSWLKVGWLLQLLGAKYSHLHQELLLVLIGMALTNLTAVITSLNHARGWVRAAWLYIPVTIIVQIVAASMTNLGTVNGLAWFIIDVGTVQCCHSAIICLLGLKYPDLIHVK